MYRKAAVQLVTNSILIFLAILFSAFSGSPLLAQIEYLQTNKNSTEVQDNPVGFKQIKTFVHPIRKFSAPIPVGAELIERKNSTQVSIRSRRGYIINIQSGDANPSLSLIQMLAKLERNYLGQGKPWSHKLNEKMSTMFGLNAIEAVYEGAGTRAKVVIARGLNTDFVIIFFAPVGSSEKLEREFKWFLSNFKPDSIEKTSIIKKPTESYNKSPISPPLLLVLKQFISSEHGFSIQYPENWELSKSFDNTIVSFSGKKGTLADVVVVSIQNVRPPAAKSSSDVVEQALTDLKRTLAQETEDFKIFEEISLTFILGNLKLSGRQIIVTYSYLGNRYRKWSILLPRPDDTIAHIWSYTAPDKKFLNFRPLADTMLKSWIIQIDRG